jgi:hypothetical protein
MHRAVFASALLAKGSWEGVEKAEIHALLFEQTSFSGRAAIIGRQAERNRLR